MPGPAGTGTHYHLRGGAGAALSVTVAGGDPGRPLVVLVLRTGDAVEGAATVRRVLEAEGRDPEAVDLGGGGGCGDAGAHGGAGEEAPPVHRVIRAPVEASDLPALERALLAGGTLAREGRVEAGGEARGPVWLEVHLWAR